MKRMIITAACCLALSACHPAQPKAAGEVGISLVDEIAVKSTTALSLAELAYNSGEAAGLATLRTAQLSKADAATLGDWVHRARAYRDKARLIVGAGGDAEATLDLLSQALTNINAIAGKK